MPVAAHDKQQLHELTVEWPSRKPHSVIVTGEFDHWSRSLHLQRTSAGTFAGTIRVPYGQPTRYKFIVDGKWMVRDGAPTDVSPEGFVNNIYWAPTEGIFLGVDRKKTQEKAEEKEESKATVEQAVVHGEAEGQSNGDVKQDPPSVQAVILASATASAPEGSLTVAPDVPVPVLPIVDTVQANGSDVPPISNGALQGRGGEASDSSKHTHIVPPAAPAALVGSSPSPPTVGKEDTSDGTNEVKAGDQNGTSVPPSFPTDAAAPAINSEGSQHHPTSEAPEHEERPQTPTRAHQSPATAPTSPQAAPTQINKSASTTSSPLSSPSKHHRSHSKSSSFLGTWKKGRSVSSPLNEDGSLERHGSKGSSSNSSGNNLDGKGGKKKKRRSSIFERLKHGMNELLHHHHHHGKEKEKSGDSI